VCGIAGIVSWGTPVDAAEVAAMTRGLTHRGPDDEGLRVRGSAGLGHRRLAIIDPPGGSQPMATRDGEVAISYNGELYNFRELRGELESLGHSFETRSDTEVVLHAWIQWQQRCVERFRGMFAFAIVDWRRGLAFLARDHFGIKPLVYFHDRERFCFASELQALREARGFPDEIDPTALDQYLALSYIPAPLTIHRGIHKLPPAHSLVVHFDGRIEQPVRYWDLRFEARRRSGDGWLEELEQVLRDSIRAHRIADVPLGALLSGGVDSSLLVSLMADEQREPVETFSIGFPNESHDERRYAAKVRDRWQTRHREAVVTPDALAILPELTAHYGEPFGDWAAIPTWYLSRMARESVPVVLSGDGADEAFGGYPRHLAAASPAGAGWTARLRDRVQRSARGRGAAADWESQTMMVIRAHQRRDLWRPEYAERIDSGGPLEAAAQHAIGLSPLRRVQSLDYACYLPGAILTKVDIASMAHGLEVRTPFVDLRVVEFAASLPSEVLVARGPGGEIEGKRPLKQILSRWFPQDFVRRPKQGFVPPAAHWFSRGGPLRGAVERSLLASDARSAEYFEPARIRALLTDLDRSGFAEPVWLLFVLEHWLRERG